jgi:hypothetical protein
MSSIRGRKLGTPSGNLLHSLMCFALGGQYWKCPILVERMFLAAYYSVVDPRDSGRTRHRIFPDDNVTFRCMPLCRNMDASIHGINKVYDIPLYGSYDLADALDGYLYTLMITTGDDLAGNLQKQGIITHDIRGTRSDRIIRTQITSTRQSFTFIYPGTSESNRHSTLRNVTFDLATALLSILHTKYERACVHGHNDLALCYLREMMRRGCRLSPFITDEYHNFILATQAYREMRRIVLTQKKSLGCLGIVTHADGFGGNFSSFTLESFIEFMTDFFSAEGERHRDDASMQTILSITEEQYAWMFVNHHNWLTLNRDLTIHRLKYFDDTQLFALAPENRLHGRMYITRESAPFLTIERIQLLMNLSDEIRRNAEKWVSDEPSPPYLFMKCFDPSVISFFLPYMPVDVIRYVRSMRGPVPPQWILQQSWHQRSVNRCLIRRIAFCCGLEDWYRNQKWTSLNDILTRISAELKARYVCE